MMLISISLLTCALNKRQIKQGTSNEKALEFSFSISACKQAFLCKNFFAGRKRYKIVYYMLYGHTFANALSQGLALDLTSKVQHKLQFYFPLLNFQEMTHLNCGLTLGTICIEQTQKNTALQVLLTLRG